MRQASITNLDNDTRRIDYVEQSKVRFYKSTTDDASATHPTTSVSGQDTATWLKRWLGLGN